MLTSSSRTGKRAAGRRSPAAGACGGSSAARRAPTCVGERTLIAPARPRPRSRSPRPRASGPSSRGRRRRASGRGARCRRQHDALGVERRGRRPRGRRPRASRTASSSRRRRAARRTARGARAIRGRSLVAARDRVHAGPADLVLQRRRRALGHDPAVVDDPDPVGEHVGLLEVLGREEHGDAVLAARGARPRPRAPCGSAGRARSSARRGRGSAAGGGRARARGRAGASSRPSSRRTLRSAASVEADALEQLVGARLRARPAGCPAASSGAAGGRGRSAAGRARPPGARRRSRRAPSALRATTSKPATRARARPSGAGASSASARSSTCPAPFGPRKP